MILLTMISLTSCILLEVDPKTMLLIFTKVDIGNLRLLPLGILIDLLTKTVVIIIILAVVMEANIIQAEIRHHHHHRALIGLGKVPGTEKSLIIAS